jgi:hypothetical protein
MLFYGVAIFLAFLFQVHFFNSEMPRQSMRAGEALRKLQNIEVTEGDRSTEVLKILGIF